MTDGEKFEIELLLSHPEILVWLETSEQEVAARLERHKREDDRRRTPRDGVKE